YSTLSTSTRHAPVADSFGVVWSKGDARPHASQQAKRLAARRQCITLSARGPVPPGAPSGRQVLTHVEIARHSIALDLSVERKREGVPDCPLGQAAAQLHHVAIDRAGEIARDELAPMNALQAAALLLERHRVLAAAGL